MISGALFMSWLTRYQSRPSCGKRSTSPMVPAIRAAAATFGSDRAKILAGLATETGFDPFVYWPESPGTTQLLRWAREVVPATRALLGG